MLKFLRKILLQKTTDNKEISKDSEQEIEDVILQRIRNKIQKLEIILDNIKTLNLQEAKSISQDLYDNQIRELNELLILMNYVLDVFAELKNYMTEYVKEILHNQYISENSKKLLIEQLRRNLQEVRRNVEKIFVEMEIFTESLKY